MSKSTKYIFVTGGVTSSLGKGIVSASLAKLLQVGGERSQEAWCQDAGLLEPHALPLEQAPAEHWHCNHICGCPHT